MIAVFVLPAGRLITGRHYKSTDEVVMKFALLLQMGLLWGGALPLIVPFLCMSALSEKLLLAMASSRGSLTRASEQGGARTAVTTTMLCSVFLHHCFVSGNSIAASLHCFVVLTALTNKRSLQEVLRLCWP